MKKLILLLTVCIVAAIAYGSKKINKSATGTKQKETSVFTDTVNVPYKLIDGGTSGKIDSSKIDFAIQFVIAVTGEVNSTSARLNVGSLILENKTITLTYRVELAGKALGLMIQYYFYLVVDKKYHGEIKLVKF
jgi:hypothetical protein